MPRTAYVAFQCKRDGYPPEVNVPGHSALGMDAHRASIPGMNVLGHSALGFSSVLCPMDSYECLWALNTGVKCPTDNYIGINVHRTF